MVVEIFSSLESLGPQVPRVHMGPPDKKAAKEIRDSQGLLDLLVLLVSVNNPKFMLLKIP